MGTIFLHWTNASFVKKSTRLLILLFLQVGLLAEKGAAQRAHCNEVTEDMGYTVRYVKITGRWVPKSLKTAVAAAVGEGTLFSQEKLNAGKAILTRAIDEGEESFPINLVGATSVLYVDVNICDISDEGHQKQLEITFRPYYIRVDLYSIGNNLLPLPRSAKSSFYSSVPKALVFTTPVVYMNSDRSRGPEVGLHTSTDLVQLPFLISGKEINKKYGLEVMLEGLKSFSKPFYSFGSAVDLKKRNYTDSSIGWVLGGAFQNSLDPVAAGRDKKVAFSFNGKLFGSVKNHLVRKYAFGVQYFSKRDTALIRHLSQGKIRQEGVAFNLLTESRAGRGVLRNGFWWNLATVKGMGSNYQQFSHRIAYGIVIGKGHTNFDLETTFGWGRSWGAVPEFDRFYAGNNYSNFLYQSMADPIDMRGRPGANIRGLGEREGVIIGPNYTSGASSYWHWNLTISLPVRQWARPLIPDILITEEPRPVSLRQALKAQVVTAKSFIAADLVDNHGYPPGDETDAYVDQLVNRDIKPTLEYLADRANIFAVKPVLLFDIGSLFQRPLKTEYFVSAGGGVQLTIVNAMFQCGYAMTLEPRFYKGNGNFVLRLAVQNFY